MLRIGITGGIGAGKSLIARVLEHMGYPVFYSDREAKALYDTHQVLKSELIALIGNELYDATGFKKDLLIQAIFENPSLKEKIENLVHPKVRAAFEDWAAQQSAELVFNEAAILFETGAYLHLNANILVTAPIELRLQRVATRDGLSIREIEKRIQVQWSDEQKLRLADYIIVNDGNAILKQIETIVQELLKGKN
ncbi:MAG: dephospho-CoA kinase [Flavobacteriales bacterium]